MQVLCQYCQAGYYKEGPQQCTLCPKGSFCTGSQIKNCKAGLTTDGTGKWSEVQCNCESIVRHFIAPPCCLLLLACL